MRIDRLDRRTNKITAVFRLPKFSNQRLNIFFGWSEKADGGEMFQRFLSDDVDTFEEKHFLLQNLRLSVDQTHDRRLTQKKLGSRSRGAFYRFFVHDQTFGCRSAVIDHSIYVRSNRFDNVQIRHRLSLFVMFSG